MSRVETPPTHHTDAPCQHPLEHSSNNAAGFATVYPAQYELKRDLAFRYLRSCVYASALNLFQELQLWDEVVNCYQLLQKPHRAEMVVREQLRSKGETPYMLTALADLTNR